MKTLSMISAAAMLAASLSVPAWAGPVGMERTTPETQTTAAQTQVNPVLIAKLEDASQGALRDGRNGNKNNIEFGRKSAQINDLIERLQRGQQVDPSEIDQALQPVHVW